MGRRRRTKTRRINNLSIEKIASEGKGLARDEEGKVIFVDYGIPGDVVDAFVYKSKKDVGIARIEKVIQPSALRVEPFCSHFQVCGGCRWQHVSYDTQLEFKHQTIQEAFDRIAKVSMPDIPAVLGGQNSQYYRNKLEYSFSNSRWLTREQIDSGHDYDKEHALGFHVPNFFDKIVDIDHCYLQKEPSNAIRLALREFAIDQDLSFYDHRKKEGFMRNVIVRTSALGEVMVIVVFGYENAALRERTLNFLRAEFPQITSLNYMINEKLNDSLHDIEAIHYSGKEFLDEKLGHCHFKIGPKSFFQTNTEQAKVLYDVTEEFAELTGKQIVYDLFTGTGTIANYVATKAAQVVGIEIIPEAIVDAEANARLNGNDNCVFFAGKVEDLFSDQLIEEHGAPDVIILDPPRAGIHQNVVDQLIKLKCPTIVYVSCNPATQARDVSLLSDWYEVTKIQPVDLFPQTFHCENVIQLKLKDTNS